MNYRNAEWRKSMQLKLDYNNMMTDYVGEEQGFTLKDLNAHKKIAMEAFNIVSENRGQKMMGWTELPYNQDEIVEDVLATAKDIKKKFDNFVVLGIGGSALGPIAAFQALCHLRHNELPKSKRKAPKLYVEDNEALARSLELKQAPTLVVVENGVEAEKAVNLSNIRKYIDTVAKN
jgi:glucose-6-phosphate isomerase